MQPDVHSSSAVPTTALESLELEARAAFEAILRGQKPPAALLRDLLEATLDLRIPGFRMRIPIKEPAIFAGKMFPIGTVCMQQTLGGFTLCFRQGGGSGIYLDAGETLDDYHACLLRIASGRGTRDLEDLAFDPLDTSVDGMM